jgi:hypothetical protein
LAGAIRTVLNSSDARYREFQHESLRIVADHDISTTLDRFEQIYRAET